VSVFEVFFILGLGAFTFYSLVGAFLPYKTVEYNLANLLLFLACVSYWVWMYLTRNEEISFWKSF
jgi:divalent metal cation (Fe/Co/Zn/Cd) transporter